jgi:hypothetical protein
MHHANCPVIVLPRGVEAPIVELFERDTATVDAAAHSLLCGFPAARRRRIPDGASDCSGWNGSSHKPPQSARSEGT